MALASASGTLGSELHDAMATVATLRSETERLRQHNTQLSARVGCGHVTYLAATWWSGVAPWCRRHPRWPA